MSNQEAFYSQLYQYIEKIANQVSDLRGSDTIKTGTIIQVLPGHYVVQLNEGNEQSSVKAIALNTSDLFSLQDYVYLMQATGSIETTYFIIGKVEQIQEDFLNLTLTERFTSSNELSGDLLKLNTKIEDLTFLSDIKANRVFQIKGTFTCNKLNEENYGLKVSFNCGDQVIKTYNLDTNYFIGQPFKMTSQPQMRTILLDEVVLKSNFDNIIITKFGSNFTCSDITIASGSLLDVNGIVNVSLSFKNKKDYFSLSGTEVDNSVKVSAEVEYEGAPLVAPGIQYYWLLKDDSIDENSEYYFSYAGKDWKCLNTYDNVSGVGADGSSLTLQIWDSGENNIILSETGFPDFINTFKCIVKYQDIVVSSPETTIYNYNKESFFVELESNIQPPLLILETDQVILSAVVEDENEKTHMSDYTCAYQWQVENENGDWEVVTKKEVSEGVFEDTFAFNEYNAEHVLTKDWSKLTIVDQLLSDMEGDSSFYVLHGEGEEIVKNFRCVVRVYRKDDLLNFISEDFSESMQVVSKVAIAAQLVSTIYYKYYISDTPYTLFPKLENGEGDWEGDWSISIKRISEEEEEYFVSQNWTEDSNLAHWSSDDLQEFPSGKVNQDAYNYIIGKFIENSQNGSYLYITSQEVWVEERLGKINFLRKDNWTIPALAKGYSNNGNYLDDKAVDKLNTFTHLTEGGLNKGLLYDEDTGDLYINADFINTGALTVADDAGEKIFYADVGQHKVEAGDFTVDNTSIRGDAVGISSNTIQENDPTPTPDAETGVVEKLDGAIAFWAGAAYEYRADAPFKVTHNGILYATGVKITELNQEVADRIAAIAAEKSARERAIEDLQNQIDGNISSWFYEGVPTLDNAPASTWKDEEKGAHLGDLYYDLKTGKCYRWAQEQNGDALEWKWVLVTDTDIALALENAAKAQATADGKITSFYGERPTEGYQYGDIWMEGSKTGGTGKVYTCIVKTPTGASSDWEVAGDFVTEAEVEKAIKVTQEDLEKLIGDLDSKVTASTYFSTAELESTSGTKIPAIVMKAKDDEGNGVMYFSTEDLVINSQNLRLNHNGSKYYKNYLYINTTPLKLYNNSYMTINTTPIKLNYSNSKYSLQINTDNFKIDSDGDVTIIGKVTATSLEIDPDAAGKAGLATSSDLSEVSSVASQAQTAAAGAQSVANAANTTAANAKAAAAGAQTAASNAAKSASDATTAATNASNSASAAEASASEATGRASEAAASAGQAATSASNAAKDAGEAKTTANTAAKDASDAKDIADGAKDIADQAKDVADTAKTTADTALKTANGTSQAQTLLSQTVKDLQDNVQATTYFKVDTAKDWICLKSNTENSSSPGMIFFDTNALVINSDQLKLNHDGTSYAEKHLTINTIPFTLNNDTGTLCGINMGQKTITYKSQMTAEEHKTITVSFTSSNTWSHVGQIEVTPSRYTDVYLAYVRLSKADLGLSDTAYIVGATCTSQGTPGGMTISDFPQTWVSYFTKEYVEVSCLVIGYSRNGSCTLTVTHLIQATEPSEKLVQYLNTQDNSFYIRTLSETDHSECFIKNVNLISTNMDSLITNSATVGRMRMNSTKIECEGLGINFTSEIGDVNTSSTLTVASISNLILVTATDALGTGIPYDLNIPIRYKLSGNANYLFTSITLPKGSSYATKEIQTDFAITEIAMQSFSDVNTFLTSQDVDFLDLVNEAYRGIGIGPTKDNVDHYNYALIPSSTEFSPVYNTWIGGYLGQTDAVWNGVFTRRLQLRGITMPTVEYGS